MRISLFYCRFQIECESLRREVASLKEDVKCAKAESCSRQRALAAKQLTSSDETRVAMTAALETEREARVAAETKLTAMRNAVARKDVIITWISEI